MAAASSAAARLPGAVTFIPAERLPAVREAFRSFDTAGSGDIAFSELPGVLRSLRYTISRPELEALSERFGGATTRLRYDTVLEIVGQVHNRKSGLPAMLEAFRVSCNRAEHTRKAAQSFASGPAGRLAMRVRAVGQ